MADKSFNVRRHNIKEFYISLFLGGGLIVLLLIGWEILSNSGIVNPMFSSSPSRIGKAALKLFSSGELLKHTLASGRIFFTGYILAVLIGVPIGIALGWFKLLNVTFSPLISAMYTTPRIALMPLFIIWFGLGNGSKVALVLLSAVFPLIVNMQVAMNTVDEDLIKVGKSYGANRWTIFWTIALPISLPFLITGLRLATGRALLGVVAAEVFGGSEGIGYLIEYSGATFQTDKVFVGVLVIAGLGILMEKSLIGVNRKFDKWRERSS